MSSYESVIKRLEGRQIPFDQDALSKAFADPETVDGACEWSNTWLNDENLLSKEEYDLFQYLEQSGLVDSITCSDFFPPSKVVSDKELEAAIESLGKSTSAIQDQVATLSVQKRAVDALTEQKATQLESTKQSVDRRRKDRDLVTKELREEAETLESSLQESFLNKNARENRKLQIERNIEALGKVLLDSHNEPLSTINQALGSSLNPEAPQENEDTLRVERLGQRLAHHKKDEIQNKLDRIFLETMIEYSDTSHGQTNGVSKETEKVDSRDTEALEQELDALHAEIGDVAKLAANQEYTDHILRQIKGFKTRSVLREITRLEAILARLNFLTANITTVTDRIESSREHQRSLEILHPSIAKALGLPDEEDQHFPPSSSPAAPRSPIRRHLSRTFSRTNSSSAADVDPEIALLRGWGVGIPGNDAKSSENSDQRPLEAIAWESNAKSIMALRNLGNTIERGIKEHVGDAERAWSEIWQVFGSDWHNGEGIRLVSEELETSVVELERGVELMSDRMGKVSLKPLQQRDKAKETFVERWAR